MYECGGVLDSFSWGGKNYPKEGQQHPLVWASGMNTKRESEGSPSSHFSLLPDYGSAEWPHLPYHYGLDPQTVNQNKPFFFKFLL